MQELLLSFLCAVVALIVLHWIRGRDNNSIWSLRSFMSGFLIKVLMSCMVSRKSGFDAYWCVEIPRFLIAKVCNCAANFLFYVYSILFAESTSNSGLVKTKYKIISIIIKLTKSQLPNYSFRMSPKQFKTDKLYYVGLAVAQHWALFFCQKQGNIQFSEKDACILFLLKETDNTRTLGDYQHTDILSFHFSFLQTV